MAVRDYLNEGGKLVYAGETAAYYGLLGGALGGIYYGLDGAPDQECAVTVDPFSDCLLLADDFTQYWLGTWGRTPVEAGGVVGTVGDLGRRRGAVRRAGGRRQPARRGRRPAADQRRAGAGRTSRGSDRAIPSPSTSTRPGRSSPSRAASPSAPPTPTTAGSGSGGPTT